MDGWTAAGRRWLHACVKLSTMSRSWVGSTTIAVAVLVNLACTEPLRAPDRTGSQSPPAARRPEPRLDHIAPPRDAIGGTPKYFEWTPVEGADRYALGIWNEVDTLVWRKDDIRTTSIDWPADLELEFGTYMWTVTALRGDVPIVDSGRSAFVIQR